MDPSPLLRRAPHARRRSSGSDEDSSKLDSTSDGAADLISSEDQLLIDMGSGDRKGESKAAAEAFSGRKNKWKDEAKPLLESKQDYIHVRARRGQATDSHSLAERARREKISQRMKILQDLVPGCSKIIGKALVLDEIINYIQSLQHQVEFLSMKLEAVNSRDNYGVELFPSKDTYDTASGLAYSSHAKKECEQGLAPDWLHMQVGGTFERVS